MANISMTDILLNCHPSTPPFMADSIEIQLERRKDGVLWIRYYVECELNSLDIPDIVERERIDGLWKTTCFELFVRRPAGDAYLEYNFSPSSQWAAYHFTGYREGMADLMTCRPRIYADASETHFAVEAELQLSVEWREGPLLVGLSAVIVENGDTISYWALVHPSGKPDFHHKDCFALRLEAPSAA